MTTWKDGGPYGLLSREIVSEDGSRAICRVKVRQIAHGSRSMEHEDTRPYPQGEADLRLILNTPVMLEALEAIAAFKLGWGDLSDVLKAYNQIKQIAHAAIAAVKGEDGQ